MQNFNSSKLIAVTDNRLTTNSHVVAAEFGKSHAHILRDVRRLKANCPADWFESNYGFRFEISDLQNGRSLRVCDMTKDGFMLLVMGFGGKKAMTKKIEFITAFNAMAEYIASGEKDLWQRMHALIAKEVGSQVRASYGSHLMLDRKRELPGLRTEREMLESAIQPSLLN